ncbi:MAG: undecaprenyldiphospho-muramoylpentapeptide beta-N-acetylglucosaminyltransferase [Desulfovibrionaceae bacterium]|nr:undecaprenyldiphospho-muramoylpentapeptide beta-N-acetylglucosaminyltransferase [Desulfovibrionaceae bacterium]
MERVILTTGGTGGHIFPALAVAEEIRRRYPGAMLLFMGGKYGQEADLAVNAGLDFIGLPVRGIMGRGLKGMGAALGMGRGLLTALAVMRKVKPQLVIGFGGYAAFAGVLAGRLSGVPTAIHEQNSFPGMSNRLLGKLVKKIFLSMPDNAGVFAAKKTQLVGNPVRAGIAALYEQNLAHFSFSSQESPKPGKSYYGGVDAPSPFDIAGRAPRTEEEIPPNQNGRQEEPHAPRLLVMGGSLGAKAINDGMIAAIGLLQEAGIEIWHQTGQADYERVRTAYRQDKAEHVRVEAFIADMPKAYAWADLVFCRAGASSLAEITAAALPSVLTPFPHAAQDHQRHNARYLEREGAAVLLEQAEFSGSPKKLVDTLTGLLRDKEQLKRMAQHSFALAKPHAARDLVDGLEALINL